MSEPIPLSAAEKPLKHKRDVILEFYSSPDAILNALHQAGWQVIPRHSEQAVDRQGEWTQEKIEGISGIFGYHFPKGFEKLCDAINAAIKCAYEKGFTDGKQAR